MDPEDKHPQGKQANGIPTTTAETPISHAARNALIFFLNQIPDVSERLQTQDDPADVFAMEQTIRGARQVFRSLGELFDTIELASIPRDLRWLNRQNRELRRWQGLAGQATHYLEDASRKSAGVKAMAQEWQAERGQAWEAMLQTLSSPRYRVFVRDARIFAETQDAGIFGKRASRRPVRYAIPSLIWEQYQSLWELGSTLAKPGPKLLRETRRQARSLDYLLAYFGTALGPAAGDCRRALQTLESHLSAYLSTHQTGAAAARFLKQAMEQELPHTGVKTFVRAQKAAGNALQAQIPAVWEPIADQTFRLDLGWALAAL